MTEASSARTAGPRSRRDARIEFDLEAGDQDAGNQRLVNLCGPLDANIAQIAAAYDVQIGRRGAHITIEGAGAANRRAREAMLHFHHLAVSPLTLDDIQLGLVELQELVQEQQLVE